LPLIIIVASPPRRLLAPSIARVYVCVRMVETRVPKVERVERFDKREKLLADSLFGTIKTVAATAVACMHIYIYIRNFLPMNV